jgi:hypothetical protein
VTEAGTALSLASQWAGDAMKRFVRLSGRKESGSLVVSSTVRLSILRALRRRRHPRGGDADLTGSRSAARPCPKPSQRSRHTASAVERQTVMELDPRAQFEGPLRLVLSVDAPGRRAGLQSERWGHRTWTRSRCVSVVSRNASKPVALETLVWLAERPRDIGRRSFATRNTFS